MVSLSTEQERAVHRAASAMVAGAILRRPVRLDDASLGGVSQQIVMGVFVSLKRHGHLRGCCGLFGAPVTLGEALGQAARRTATEDARFPPVSPTELPYLDLEVWLLEQPQPVTALGRDRIAAVTIGRHGLQIRRGNASGLLLPGVAVENQLDAETFLEWVCRKANLPPTAWQEADAHLVTFEGQAIEGPFEARAAAEAAQARIPLLDGAGAARLARHCRKNLQAFLQGRAAGCYSLECPDGTAHVVTLAVRLPDGAEALRVSRLSLRPGLPLQATLHGLAEAAARSVAAQGLDPEVLAGVEIQVTVLWDPAMHGTVLEPDFDGMNPARRSLLVLEGVKWAWVHDPQRSAEELLARAARAAQVSNPATALLLSLATESTEPSTAVAEVPRPQTGAKIRPPAVAGSFYPGDAETLWRLTEELLGEAGERPEVWSAVLVPHAGLKFSGRVAAAAFRRVEIPDVVIILGPQHSRAGMEWAVAPHDAWALPGATVASDPELARHLAGAIPDLHLDALAHEREHSIEVQLPFLARLAPSARVVGITLGAATFDRCRQFASGLAEVLLGRADRPLLVISSDLNHYASDAENRRLDAIALTALEGLDPAALYATVTRHKISMCGLLPAVIVLETLRQLEALRRCQRVAYATSADAGGDESRVVGYAGMLFGPGAHGHPWARPV